MLLVTWKSKARRTTTKDMCDQMVLLKSYFERAIEDASFMLQAQVSLFSGDAVAHQEVGAHAWC